MSTAMRIDGRAGRGPAAMTAPALRIAAPVAETGSVPLACPDAGFPAADLRELAGRAGTGIRAGFGTVTGMTAGPALTEVFSRASATVAGTGFRRYGFWGAHGWAAVEIGTGTLTAGDGGAARRGSFEAAHAWAAGTNPAGTGSATWSDIAGAARTSDFTHLDGTTEVRIADLARPLVDVDLDDGGAGVARPAPRARARDGRRGRARLPHWAVPRPWPRGGLGRIRHAHQARVGSFAPVPDLAQHGIVGHDFPGVDRVDAVAVGLNMAAVHVNLGADLTDIAFDSADADGKQAESGKSGSSRDRHRERAAAVLELPYDFPGRVFANAGLDERVLQIRGGGGHEPGLSAKRGMGVGNRWVDGRGAAVVRGGRPGGSKDQLPLPAKARAQPCRSRRTSALWRHW